VHNVVPVISLGVYRLARELGVPIIQWLHNYRPLSPSGTLKAGDRQLEPDDLWIGLKETLAGSWRGRFLTGWLTLGYALSRRRGDFESVRAWITVSEEMRRVFERGGWPRDRVFVLHHSWDIQSPATGLDEGYFLFLGRMIEPKGVRFLVDLWRRPALKGVPLVLAGEGKLYDEFRQQHLPDIRCVGYVQGDEKRRLVASCRAILFPSLWPEPLSTVAYEGYEQGKPILASKLGGMKELVLNDQTGRLLKPGDADAWQDAILEHYRDADLSRKLGANGRRWLEENVSPATWNRRFNAIAQQILGKA
jgi:glycosyltransferase involved in cell wall biosynthesis